MIASERYHPHSFAVNESRIMTGSGLGGFICVTAGSISVISRLGTAILTSFPVAAGTVYGLPMYLGVNGFTVTLAGGASGVVLTQ